MLKTIEITNLYSKSNIRQEKDETIHELADSIVQHGLLQPLVVQKGIDGKYEIIAGHRRFEALKRINEQFIPCNVIEDEAAGKDRILLQLTENCQRKNMAAWELVEVFNELMEKYRMNKTQIGKYMGKSDAWVHQQYEAVRLLENKYGATIPEAEKKKSAYVIKAEHKKTYGHKKEYIYGKGFNCQKAGHTYMIFCTDFETEQSLNEWLNAGK